VSVGDALDHRQLGRVKRAVQNAELSSGLQFSVYVGATDQDSRAYAERLHAALDDPTHSVLVVCDPKFRSLEIVTGAEARRTLGDVECGFAAAAMQTSFAAGDVVGGLVVGVQQLGEAARAPRTLHVNT